MQSSPTKTVPADSENIVAYITLYVNQKQGFVIDSREKWLYNKTYLYITNTLLTVYL